MNINRVAIIGECMVELRKTKQGLEQGFGGDTLNTAVYLSRLTHSSGVTTSYVTWLGSDPFSSDMLTQWHDENLNTDMVYQVEGRMPGIYAIETAEDGERSFYYWRNESAAKFWIRDHAVQSLTENLSRHQLIYLSGISLAILPNDCRKKLLDALTLCKRNGTTIAFDNNYRPALWDSIEDAQYWYREMLTLTDIAFITYDDDVMLWGDKNEQYSILRTQSFGVDEIIMKRGSEACFVIKDGQTIEVPSSKIDNVIDTTAAGDSFSAGYLAKRLLGGSLQESALSGHKVAGTVIQHRGAVIDLATMPTI